MEVCFIFYEDTNQLYQPMLERFLILHFKYVEEWLTQNATITFIGIQRLETVLWVRKTLLRLVKKTFTPFEKRGKKYLCVRCGVRTHARLRVPELKSGALDHSANLTQLKAQMLISVYISKVYAAAKLHNMCMYYDNIYYFGS